MSDMREVITLLTAQEERLVKKIDLVHDDVKITRDDVKAINGRVRKTEVEIATVKATCAARTSIVDSALKEVKPASRVTKVINWILTHPKISLFVFLLTVVTIQVVVLIAIEKQWLGKIFEKILS